MRDCPNAEIRDLLPDYANGSLTGETLARVTSHVASCADCAEELELVRVVRSAMRSAPVVHTARIVASLPSPAPTASHVRRTRFATTWRIAATIAVLAAGGVAVKVAREGAVPVDPALQQPPTFDTALAAVPPQAPAVAPSPPLVAVKPTPSAPKKDTMVASTNRAPHDGLTLTGGLSDLSAEDIEALLADLETLDPVPTVDPEAAATVPTRRRRGL
jgi:hypothetical protein